MNAGNARSGHIDMEPVQLNKNTMDDRRLPKESGRDLRPFPMNQYYRSEPVLSDRLRWDVWARIMKEGQSVREVSAELGVEMSRVGAVVRLCEVEQEWKRIVSIHLCFNSALHTIL